MKFLKSRNFWLWALFVLSIFLKYQGLWKQLWIDEGWAWLRAQSAEYRGYYKYSAGWMDSYFTAIQFFKLGDLLAFNGSVALLRLPFFICGLISIWLAWLYGKTRKSFAFAFLFALFMAISPFKAVWDTMFRYYGVMIPFFLLLIMAGERFRRNPNWKTFSLFLGIGLLASWTHIISLVLVSVCCIYLAGSLVRTLVKTIFSRGPGRGRQIGLSVLKHAGWGAAWLCVSMLAACVTLGPEKFMARLESTVSIAPFGKSSADINREDSETNDSNRSEISAELSTGPEMLAFLGNSYGNFHGPDGFWIWSLMNGNKTVSSFLARGYLLSPAQEANWVFNPTFNALLALCLILGFAISLKKTPDLTVSLLAVSYITLSVMSHGIKTHFLETRYYLYPLLSLTVFCIAGLAALLEAAHAAMRRVSLKWGAAGLLAMCLSLGVFCAAFISPWTKIGSTFNNKNEFESLHKFVMDHVKGPALHDSEGECMFRILDALTARADKKWSDPENFWSHPSKNSYLYYYPVRCRGTGLLAKLAPYESFVFSLYTERSDALNPLGRNRALFESFGFERLPSAKPDNMTFYGAIYHQKNNLFVMGGHCAIPLMPRFAAENEGSAAGTFYDIALRFEIPGNYKISIGSNPEDIKRIGAAGRVETKPRSAPLETISPAATGEYHQRHLREIGLAPGGKGYGPAVRIPVMFYGKVGGKNPINFSPKSDLICYSNFTIQAMTPTPLIIEFNKPMGERVPIIEFTYAPGDQELTRLCDYAGFCQPKFTEDADNLYLSVPICITKTNDIPLIFRAGMRQANGAPIGGDSYVSVEFDARDYKIGDYALLGR